MILLSELSRRRIRSINKLIRVGRNEVVVVIRVDKEKGYIDLSKRRVSSEEILKCEDKFARGKTVNSILRHTAEVLKLNTDAEFEDLYERTAWKIDEKYKKPGYAYDFFKQCVTEPQIIDECDISPEWREILLSNIRRRLTPQAVKCRADVEVSCYSYEGITFSLGRIHFTLKKFELIFKIKGIDAIKASLREGLKLSTEDKPVKINLIAPPVYVITSSSLDRDEGVKLLQDVIEKIKASIESFKGRFKVKMAPKVVTDLDEAELARQMEQMEAENEQVAGDTDSEEGESEDDGEIDTENLKANDEDDPKLRAVAGLMKDVDINKDEDDGDDQQWE